MERRDEVGRTIVSSVVVDTNILSYELKHDTRAALYAPHLRNRTLAISFVTLTELSLWTNRRNWGERRLSEMNTLLGTCFVIYPNDEICRIWAKITLACERKGRQIPEDDAWIASCAIYYDAPLITHNWRDFANVAGLDVITENV